MSAALTVRNFHGWETLVNAQVGYAPYFSSMIVNRVRRKKACNVVITGEPGEGKSYAAIDLMRILEGITSGGNERFKIGQVVFTYKDYMTLVIRLRMGKGIVFDEPSYAMGKRDWYKDLNKALVQTVESQRFKVHPLFIPIINKALLDKSIRNYLLQYQVHVIDRGRALVYRIKASQSSEKIYRYGMCNLEYEMLDTDRCTRDSCLDCKKILDCSLFRAQYERKKALIQESRYGQALDMAKVKESTLLTDEQIENQVLPLSDQFTNSEGKIDIDLLRIVASRQLSMKIGHNKAYRIAKMLRYDYPKRFL